MNHLAHLLLAGPHDEFRLGAFLGDHVKGRAALEDLAPARQQGVVLHRKIDSFSDAHPAVRNLLVRLDAPFRRYGGVISDVLFDHMLTRHWERFAEVPLDSFARSTDALLARYRSELPERLQRFAAWAQMQGLWSRYGDRAMLGEIFERIGIRHGRTSPLHRGLEVLDREDGAIEEAFLELYPDLEKMAARFRATARVDGAGPEV